MRLHHRIIWGPKGFYGLHRFADTAPKYLMAESRFANVEITIMVEKYSPI